MIKIAVTGGIACGKSELIKYLADKKYKVFSADKINAELLQNDEYINEIKKRFPEAVKRGAVDKVKLRQIIAADGERSKVLTDIAHPLIARRLSREMESSGGVAFAEVPLLVESGMQEMFDYVIAIRAEAAQRLKRAMDRDGADGASLKGIMALQASDEEREKYADFVIINDGSKDSMYAQAEEILKMLNI